MDPFAGKMGMDDDATDCLKAFRRKYVDEKFWHVFPPRNMGNYMDDSVFL